MNYAHDGGMSKFDYAATAVASLAYLIQQQADAIGLVLLAMVQDPYTYLAAWAFLGIAMRLSLYDAAFAALVQVTPSRGRRAISYLTLFGGFASTVFWPIGHALNAAYGWRTTLLIFAAINLAVCLPLNWFGLSRHENAEEAAPAAAAAPSPDGPALEGRMRVVGIVLFAFATRYGDAFAGWTGSGSAGSGDGEPSFTCSLQLGTPETYTHEGMVATTMRVVNAIPYVCDAAPGIVTSLDLPLTLPHHAFEEPTR